MSVSTGFTQEAAVALTSLFRGVLFNDAHPRQWESLISYQTLIRDYVSVIGLELYLDEREGFAFLRQKDSLKNENGVSELPRLIQNRQLGFHLSLLCVLLRRKLAEQDASGTESRTILSREQIVDMLRVFLPDSENEIRAIDQIDGHILKLTEYGLLRKLKTNDSYEISRVIRAVVDAEWLGEMSEKFENYRKHANELI